MFVNIKLMISLEIIDLLIVYKAQISILLAYCFNILIVILTLSLKVQYLLLHKSGLQFTWL